MIALTFSSLDTRLPAHFLLVKRNFRPNTEKMMHEPPAGRCSVAARHIPSATEPGRLPLGVVLAGDSGRRHADEASSARTAYGPCKRQDGPTGSFREVRPELHQPAQVRGKGRAVAHPLHTCCRRRGVRSVAIVFGKCRPFGASLSRNTLCLLRLVVNLRCFCSRSAPNVYTPILGVGRGSIPPASTSVVCLQTLVGEGA